MRTKKAFINTVASLALEAVAIICSFILPRLILRSFGSEYNGITASISQFLSCVALLKAGVGGVTRASLYKPLAENNVEQISSIIRATEIFMRKVAMIFAGIVLIVAVSYPFVTIKDGFSWHSIFLLVLILSVGTFAQYYFGITYQTLLGADQRQYVISALHIVTTILNTAIAVILVNAGCSIHIVKLGSALVFAANPLFMHFYVKKRYKLNPKATPNNQAIKQRWDALAHQVALFIHQNTDLVIITFFAGVKEVSVYTVYSLVSNGVRKFIQPFSSGIEAAFGNMMAKNEDERLKKNFNALECLVFSLSTVSFVIAALLIVSFVTLYTHGVTDADYARPMFAYILLLAEFFFCVRTPYQYIAHAAGHFKQTRNASIIEAVMNVVLSLILVNFLGIVGVAIGTLCAMVFRTTQYAIYASRAVVKRSTMLFLKRVFISVVNAAAIVLIANELPLLSPDSYLLWVVNAFMIGIMAVVVTLLFTVVFYRDELKTLIQIIQTILKKKKAKTV